MYIIIVGMLVLLCVSTVCIVMSHREGVKVLELPTRIQRHAYNNTIYEVREYSISLLIGVFGLLMLVAYPLTYILAYINAVVFKLYLYLKHITVPAIKDLIK